MISRNGIPVAFANTDVEAVYIPNDHMPPESNIGNPPTSCRPENSVEPPIKGWKIVQNFPAHQKPGSVDRNLERRLRLGHGNRGKKRVDQNNPEQNCKHPQARRNCHERRKNGKLYAEHAGSSDRGQECNSASMMS